MNRRISRLLVSLTRHTPGRDSAVSEYYWGGAAGTYMWVDPANDLFIVYMMQSPKQRVPHRAALRELVYGAVVDAKVAGGKSLRRDPAESKPRAR